MTEYEMTDILISRFATMTGQAALYFALVSGYLAVAYLAGNRLTRIQVVVVSSLFVTWSLRLLVGWNSSVEAALELEAALFQSGSKAVSSELNFTSVHSFLLVQVIGIVASLIFMWDVRHTNNE